MKTEEINTIREIVAHGKRYKLATNEHLERENKELKNEITSLKDKNNELRRVLKIFDNFKWKIQTKKDKKDFLVITRGGNNIAIPLSTFEKVLLERLK